MRKFYFHSFSSESRKARTPIQGQSFWYFYLDRKSISFSQTPYSKINYFELRKTNILGPHSCKNGWKNCYNSPCWLNLFISKGPFANFKNICRKLDLYCANTYTQLINRKRCRSKRYKKIWIGARFCTSMFLWKFAQNNKRRLLERRRGALCIPHVPRARRFVSGRPLQCKDSDADSTQTTDCSSLLLLDVRTVYTVQRSTESAVHSDISCSDISCSA